FYARQHRQCYNPHKPRSRHMTANHAIGDVGISYQGADVIFRPSLLAISRLGSPADIIGYFVELQEQPRTRMQARRQLRAALHVPPTSSVTVANFPSHPGPARRRGASCVPRCASWAAALTIKGRWTPCWAATVSACTIRLAWCGWTLSGPLLGAWSCMAWLGY